MVVVGGCYHSEICAACQPGPPAQRPASGPVLHSSGFYALFMTRERASAVLGERAQRAELAARCAPGALCY